VEGIFTYNRFGKVRFCFGKVRLCFGKARISIGKPCNNGYGWREFIVKAAQIYWKSGANLLKNLVYMLPFFS
jgi:hypothetical protein